ncbi:MAG: hypothetical protein K2N51_00710 [Lachnospiraceae bacterium]|nr:hypothetical protein [Lachnospiraceae bacterium]
MKKRLSGILICGILVLGLATGCTNDRKADFYYSEEEQNEKEKLANITTEISDISFTGATVIITDENKEPYTYGEWYKIEKEENGKWIELETKIKDYAFDLIGYPLDKNNQVKFVIDWEWLYGELDIGNYRIVKHVDDLHEYIYIPFSISETS